MRILFLLLGWLAGAALSPDAASRLLTVRGESAGRPAAWEVQAWDSVLYAETGLLRHWFPHIPQPRLDSGTVLLSLGQYQLVLAPGNPFGLLDQSVINFTRPVRCQDGAYWIPVAGLCRLLETVTGRLYRWVPGSDTVTTASASAIQRVTCEALDEGTAATVYLPVPYAYTASFFPPQFNLNFFNAALDSPAVAACPPAGLVREVNAIPFDNAAQISLILDPRAAPPEVYRKENPERLVVVIKKVAPAGAELKKPAPAGPAAALPGPIIRTVVIDPGHGGEDPGAISREHGTQEKDVTLAVALKLKDLIAKRTDWRVVMTRSTDTFISLRERKQIANREGGQLFLSIHANAVKGQLAKRASTNGYIIYFLDVADNDESRMLEALENSVLKYEETEPDPAQNALDLMLNMVEKNLYRTESQTMAGLVSDAIGGSLRQVRPRKTGVGQANFYVLRGPNMPSILVETAFISNPEEARLLTKDKFQQQMAECMYQAIVNFKKVYEKT